MFDNLKGIQKGRNIQQRAESALEKLLKVEQEVHQEYAGKVSDKRKENHDNIYLPLYQSLGPTIPDYTEREIQDLLIAKSDNNYNNNEAQVLGMYTGVLLHILTERYEKEGKKAAFTFDLLGNEFDYLFFFAKRAGELTVRNVKGRHTCAFLAAYGGTAEKLVLEKNEGDDAASWAGSNNGNIGTLVIQGNEGDWAAYGVGSYGGTVGTLVIKDNKGHNAAGWAGSYNGNVGTLVIEGNKGRWAASGAGRNGGTVGTLIINNNKGDWAAFGAGNIGGNVGTLVIKDNEGNDAAFGAGSLNGNVGTLVINGNEGNNAASSAGSHDGTVGTLVIHENKGDDAASWAGSWGGNVSTLALYEAGRKAGIYAKAKRIITGEEALELYHQWEQGTLNTRPKTHIETIYQRLRRILPWLSNT